MAEPTQQPLLSVQDAYTTYGQGSAQTVAINHVDLDVLASPATITTIAGESGSDKTTLALEVVGLRGAEVLDHHPHQLSGASANG